MALCLSGDSDLSFSSFFHLLTLILLYILWLYTSCWSYVPFIEIKLGISHCIDTGTSACLGIFNLIITCIRLALLTDSDGNPIAYLFCSEQGDKAPFNDTVWSRSGGLEIWLHPVQKHYALVCFCLLFLRKKTSAAIIDAVVKTRKFLNILLGANSD